MAGAPPAPFIAPTSGDLEQRLQQIADAINKKANITTVPTYASIRLMAPDGSTWVLSVSATGNLSTVQTPR